MDGLTIFALFVLLILLAAIVAIWIVLGMMPEKIARQRKAGLASIGYRYVPMTLDISYDNDAFKAELDFAGPYLGLRFAY